MVQFIKNRFKGSEMTHKNEETVVDAQMHHPFRCLVAGPSQSGKSTFVCNLLLQQNDIIDIHFDYVTIVLGTEANKNEILSTLKDDLRPGVHDPGSRNCAIFVRYINSSELHLQSVALRSQYSDPAPEAVTLQ